MIRKSLLRFQRVRLFSIGEYHEAADQCLEDILESYESLSETKVPDLDCDMGQGVLTITIPHSGTYVINKQPPNKQIWLSSPISGPKRYDWADGKWVYLRDHSTLGELLRHETKNATNEELDLSID